jgi:hypothetical protein
MTCGSAIDQVQVNVVNRAPNAPSITHPPTNSFNTGFNIDTIMGVSAEDQDGDALFYEMDWNMDGTPDAPGGATTPSGVTQNVTHRWTTSGTEPFQMRAVDTSGATSPWTQSSMTVDVPPAPVPVLEVQINSNPFTTEDQTINPGDTLTMRWSSTNTTSCNQTSGAGFDTGGNPSGTDPVNPPAPNTSDTFGATCTGPGGSGGDSITITTRQLPNFNQPSISWTPAASFNQTTGMYDYLDVTFQTTNDGGSATQVSANYELQFDQGRNGYEQTVSGSLGLLAASDPVNRGERMTGGIPFGPARIRVMADNTNAVAEANETDNTRELDIMITPPNPGLTLTAAQTQLRNGETTTLTWSTTTTYPMTCRVYGPGVDVNPSGHSGTRATAPINAKSEYTFTCVEPVTNTTFTDRVVVETQGEVEEI